ncbi:MULTISPECIES: prohead protease/major capsid protein fusion protein [unclassified Haematobacter]|uniref:prohead protease/major capsid protein fusion protein n=1 Tax=unclassified Haematobacter TaxID=2640585 RepID=UPI0025BB18BE|nr:MULTISPECIES: prohead protease/major capsid protein fusion protein [unclassified Haematobacter]
MTIHLRNLTPRPVTVDREARTVEAIASTYADVRRAAFIERIGREGADLSRLIGAPVLDGHRSQTTRDQLGVIEAADLRPEGLWVRIRFRSNDAAQAVFNDIADGTIRGLSVGFTVSRWIERQENGQRVRIAAAWTPLEVSVVPIPADPGATFRNMDMEQETIEQPQPGQQQTNPGVGENRAEINREIRSLAQTAHLPRDWADEQIDAGVTVEEARRAAFEAMQTRSQETRTTATRATITMDHDAPETRAERAGEALYARLYPDHTLSAPARAFAGMTLPEMMRDSFRRRGISTSGMGDAAVIQRAMTESDLPLLLGNTLNRALRREYEAAPSAIHQVARKTTAPDFRPKETVWVGDVGKIQHVGESGEYKGMTLRETKESYSVDSYGGFIGVSEHMIVNDTLGGLNRIAPGAAASCRSFEAEQLIAKVTSNPTLLEDGVAVFDAASHKNAHPASTIKADLSASRLALRKQTSPGGTILALQPKYVLAPAELETDFQQALSEIAATKTDDVNPFQNLQLLIEPRLTSATQWYLLADPAQIDGLEYAYLEGMEGPQIITDRPFFQDGFMWKVKLKFGCGWLDYRGWQRVG